MSLLHTNVRTATSFLLALLLALSAVTLTGTSTPAHAASDPFSWPELKEPSCNWHMVNYVPRKTECSARDLFRSLDRQTASWSNSNNLRVGMLTVWGPTLGWDGTREYVSLSFDHLTQPTSAKQRYCLRYSMLKTVIGLDKENARLGAMSKVLTAMNALVGRVSTSSRAANRVLSLYTSNVDAASQSLFAAAAQISQANLLKQRAIALYGCVDGV